MKFVSSIRHATRGYWKILYGTFLRVTRGTDRARWLKAENLHANWSSRTIQMARLIPSGMRVLEFGCGAGTLVHHLPANTQYIASDVVPRVGAIVIDLNAREIPSLPVHDVAFLSGVLEYIHDIPRAARAITAAAATQIIASYAVCDTNTHVVQSARRRSGFVTDLSRDAFVALMQSAGWRLRTEEIWESGSLSQKIFVFVR